MFEQSMVEARGIAARPWSLAASLTMQTALVSVAILFPLVHPEMLQKVSVYVPVIGPPRAYHPPAPQRTEVTRAPVTRRTMSTGFFAPASVPARIAQIVDPPPEVAATPSALGDGVPGGMPWVGDVSPVIARLSERPMPVQPPQVAAVKPLPKPPVTPSAPIRQSSGVQAALLIYGPKPPYPPLARQARIQGSVHLAAVIGTDGRVLDLHATDGHPLFVSAAIDAVKHWIYKPTLLNGEPVQVVTEITVTFTLSN